MVDSFGNMLVKSVEDMPLPSHVFTWHAASKRQTFPPIYLPSIHLKHFWAWMCCTPPVCLLQPHKVMWQLAFQHFHCEATGRGKYFIMLLPFGAVISNVAFQTKRFRGQFIHFLTPCNIQHATTYQHIILNVNNHMQCTNLIANATQLKASVFIKTNHYCHNHTSLVMVYQNVTWPAIAYVIVESQGHDTTDMYHAG